MMSPIRVFNIDKPINVSLEVSLRVVLKKTIQTNLALSYFVEDNTRSKHL